MAPKLAGTIAAGAALVGVTAAMNALVANPSPPNDALPGRTLHYRFRGYDVAATEAGAGPLLVLVHGIYAGSSSYEFRRLMPLLASSFRVVALDLLGNGRSERPNIRYSADLFIEQVRDALERFGPATALVGSSLGGAFSIAAAARGAPVGAVVALCPTGVNGNLDGSPPRSSFITALIRTPVLGEGLFNLLASPPSLRWFLRHQGYANPAAVTPEVVEHYYRATHQRGARFVPAWFVGGGLRYDIEADLRALTVPLLVGWGTAPQTTSPPENAERVAALAPHAQRVSFARSALLPHEEEPEAVAASIVDFLRQRSSSAAAKR